MNISVRFVGTEPFCKITALYNEKMKELLPQNGIEVVEIKRKDNISASEVRKAIKEGELEKIKNLVPKTVYEYITGNN